MRGPFHYLTQSEMDAVVSETTGLCQRAYQLLWEQHFDCGEWISVLEMLED